jgi:hypothetical protein
MQQPNTRQQSTASAGKTAHIDTDVHSFTKQHANE